jgi:general secretion pathway protein A
MYNQFFGLREAPFNTTPDPRFLFLTAEHRRALAGLTHAVCGRKPVVLLVGEIGTGKTTLIATALQCIPADRAQFSVLTDPPLTAPEVLEAVLLGFGVKEIPSSRSQCISKLQEFLQHADQKGQICTLVIDEVHKLSPGALEEVRLLGNLDSLQIVLAGQTEVNELLNSEALRALKQRIVLRLTLNSLSAVEVEQYILHRWAKSGGGQSPPFTADAVAAIGQGSKGVPRLINSICDNALLLAFEQKHDTITRGHILQSLLQLDLLDSTSTQSSTAAPPIPVVRLINRLTLRMRQRRQPVAV